MKIAKYVLPIFFLATHLWARPNVIVVMTDDQGYGELSAHGNPVLQTPHLDRLHAQGIRLHDFHVAPMCTPSRGQFLTGMDAARNGAINVSSGRTLLRPELKTMADVFQAGGYRTDIFGKWHLGDNYPYRPQERGFDEVLTHGGGGIGNTPDYWGNNYNDDRYAADGEWKPFKGYCTDVWFDAGLDFIERHCDEPFMCFITTNAPHSPFQVPDRYFDKFKAKGFEDDVAAFYGMCENLDDNVGRLLAHLESLKLAEDTIVLFLTDNGGTAGVKTFNAGMRGGKTSVHEGGTRVPLFVRWPAAKWQPHVVKPIVSHIDLFPTLLDLCGVKPPAGPKMDGVTLRPLLEKADPGDWPERTLFTHNPISETNKFPGAVRAQRYRLVREIKGPAGGSKAKANDASATPWQLYDMQSDPGETKDIAADHPDIVKQLAAIMKEEHVEQAE